MDYKDRHFNTSEEKDSLDRVDGSFENPGQESAEEANSPEIEESRRQYESAMAEEETETKGNQADNGLQNSRLPKDEPKSKKTLKKTILTSFSAGVLGTVLTLSVVPFTNYGDWLVGTDKQDSSSNAINNSKDLSTEGAVEIQKTSVTASDIADMVEEASPAIVGVVNIQKQQAGRGYYFPYEQQGSAAESVESGIGSGVIFKVEGNAAYIVTNNHVIEGADEIEIALSSGEKTSAELVGADSLTDLAVLKMDAQYVEAVLEFGDSSVLRAGEEVIAIGNPLGLDYAGSVTQGIVSAVERTVSVETSAGDWDLTTIQTDAAINPGNSGGALMNTRGQVIGINSLKISDDNVEGIGFAIPSNDAVPIINEIMETGQVNRAYLGIGLASLEDIPQYYLQSLPEEVKGGVVITSVQEGSAASNAGLQVQDVIVAVNGTEVANSSEFRKYLYSDMKPGDEVTLDVYRSGKKMTKKVTLGSTVE